ncbi:hypothetical protein [Sphingosinicella sp.]|uniref:hypothetical protein n=1 Tax=Sphingosinicella sp. TaxID=1917971 RepID=UPI00403771B1
MKPTRKTSRRSFLGIVAGGAICGGMLGIVTGRAGAQGYSDSDTGPRADPAGRAGAGGGSGRRRPSPATAISPGRFRKATPSSPTGRRRRRPA